MKILRWAVVAAVLLLAILPIACRTNGFQTGTYATSLGLWEMEFREDGTVVVRDPALGEYGELDSGTYAVNGEELIFESSIYCATDAGKATYTWTFEDGVLALTPVGEDPCAGRAEVLASEWHKQ
jgi:hypothetical protein